MCHSIAGTGLTSNKYFAQGHSMILRVTAWFLWNSALSNALKDTFFPAAICFFRGSETGEEWLRVFLELQKEEKGKVGIRLFVKEKSQHHSS